MTVLFTLFLNLNNKLSLGVQLEPQGFNVPITEAVHTELLCLYGYQHSVCSGKGIDK